MGCGGEDDDPIYVSGLPAAYYGALLDESSGQILAHAVCQVLRMSVRAEREMLLQGQQVVLQKRLLQVSRLP